MSSEQESDGVVIGKKVAITPPGYDIGLTEQQAVAIAEFVDSPVFKILQNVFVAQRKDHIARQALNGAQSSENLFYFKGMAAELVLHYKTLKSIKKLLQKDPEAEK